MAGVTERTVIVHDKPAFPSAEYYLQGGLRVDDTQQMKRIEGACLLFVARIGESVSQNPSFVMIPRSDDWPVPVVVDRHIALDREITDASRDVLNKYCVQGLRVTPENETLTGLRLCLISAVQLLGVERTKALRDFPQDTNDERAALLGFFNSHYALERRKVMKKIGETSVQKFERDVDKLMMAA